ncbi:hypothetical protein TNCV_3883691 [Trichonephila clavipes]|nr:hypothetical protein TNCV_3883691 [Trichonephila clavipes]
MSDEATTIRVVRSPTVASGVTYTRGFRWYQKKKSKGLRSTERESQEIDPPCPIYLLVCITWFWLCTEREKCAGEPLFWCSGITKLPVFIFSRRGKFAFIRVGFLNPNTALRNPAFFWPISPRLAHRPNDGCYYGNFHRLHMICDPMLYGNLPSPCCFL